MIINFLNGTFVTNLPQKSHPILNQTGGGIFDEGRKADWHSPSKRKTKGHLS
ncbi:hypothetical protein SAMN02746062_01403 [Alysiella filiformis DSM 16848]|uniref:Uncharacterized protein n=1 Tax=Alysiella filiformis DSM 16848 TaxID=1120981 RepID=A0A286ECZ6_9NEIS|nr:hypothetical protein SAMN02746062_01403 [Alysiella filiformis DSM 16848]